MTAAQALAPASPPNAAKGRDALGLAVAYEAPRSATEAALGSIWSTTFGLDRVGIRDDFFKLGGDSLKGATLVALIEERFGCKLPLATLLRRPTIETLATHIDGLVGTGTPDILVPLRSEGTRPPLFLVHGGGGLVHVWPEWLTAIGADQPVYGIEARGSRDEAAPHDTVEAMAADYISVLRRVHAKGPYHLGGVCIGGMIAYEMAQQLLAAGDPPATLLLVDPLAQARRPEGAVGEVDELGRTTAGQAFVEEVRGRMQRLLAARGVQQTEPSVAERLVRSLIRVQDGINAAADRYVLKPYPRFVDFFCSGPERQLLRADARGWRSCTAGKARIWPVGTDHHSLFAEESGRLGQCMRDAIERGGRARSAGDMPGGAAGGGPGAFGAWRRAAAGSGRGRPPLFLIRDPADGALPPSLGKALGQDQPVVDIDPGEWPDASASPEALATAAEGCLAQIRRIVPRGALLLGGTGRGAVLAFVLAHRLLGRGQGTVGLILIEPGFAAFPAGVQPIPAYVAPLDIICSASAADAIQGEATGWREVLGREARLCRFRAISDGLLTRAASAVGKALREAIDRSLARFGQTTQGVRP